MIDPPLPSSLTVGGSSDHPSTFIEALNLVTLQAAVHLLRSPDWQQDLCGILQSLAVAVLADRAYLIHQVDQTGSVVCEWHAASGADRQPGIGSPVESEAFIAHLQSHTPTESDGGVAVIAGEPGSRDQLLILDIEAGGHWGWMIFAFCEPLKVWSAEGLNTLRFAAKLIAAAIERFTQAEAIISSEIRLRTLFEQIPAVVYTAEMTDTFHITWVSPQVEHYLGRRAEEFLADRDLWQRQIFPPDRTRVSNTIHSAIETKSALSVEFRIVTKSGSPIWFRNDARIVFDSAGNPRFIQGVLLDIHQRKTIGAELNRLYHEEHMQRLMVEGLTVTSSALSATMDVDKIPDLLLQELAHILRYDTATFWFVEGNELVLSRARGYSLIFGENVDRYLVDRVNLMESPILASILESGKPLIVEKVQPASGQVPHSFSRHVHSWAGAPIIVHGKPLGLFTIESRESGRFTNNLRSILSAICGQASMSFQNARLFKTEQQLRARAELLQKATTALTAELELPQLLEQVMDYLGGVVAYDSVCMFLVEGDGGAVRAVAGRGFDKPQEILGRLYKSDILFSIVAQQKSPLVLQDTMNDDRFCRWGGAEHIRGWMCLPLIWREKIIGFMTVDSRMVNAYNDEDANYAQAFANQAASAIQISRLFTEAQALAISDPLTGVYNRRHFFELAGQHIATVRESNQTASAIMIDVDNYKKVNDTYGHLSGDQILKVVTGCFTSVLGTEEILARMGGDEFIILLPNRNRTQAEQVAEQLRSTLEHATIRVKNAEVAITASFGVAEIDPLRMDLDDMINRADQALYFSKNAGRNTVS